MTIRFDDAWSGARTVAEAASDDGYDVVLIRDILGRVALVLDSPANSDAPAPDFSRQLIDRAGPFVSPTPVRHAHDLFAPDQIQDSPDLVIERPRTPRQGQLAVLENRIVGTDWTRSSSRRWENPRVTLYGFKGGVGRSTALFMLAKHLAEEGRCVLVVDLDLESPGIGALAQLDEDLCAHGIVDHLVEDAVGNSDGLDLVCRSMQIEPFANGEVWVAPAAGRPRDGYDYLAKLNRIYTDLPPSQEDGPRSFADRIHSAISACESAVAERSRAPDVVLLDSRAGIHDVAAVALSLFHLGSACVDEGLYGVDELGRVVWACSDPAEGFPAFELGVGAFAGAA